MAKKRRAVSRRTPAAKRPTLDVHVHGRPLSPAKPNFVNPEGELSALLLLRGKLLNSVASAYGTKYSVYTVDATPCAICCKKNQYEDFILCDGCNNGQHKDCAGLTKVPEGTWFCSSCLTKPSLDSAIRQVLASLAPLVGVAHVPPCLQPCCSAGPVQGRIRRLEF